MAMVERYTRSVNFNDSLQDYTIDNRVSDRAYRQ